MNEDEIKQLQRQVSKLQLEAKLRKSVANELERQKNLECSRLKKRQRSKEQYLKSHQMGCRSICRRKSAIKFCEERVFRDTERQKILNGLLLRYC